MLNLVYGTTKLNALTKHLPSNHVPWTESWVRIGGFWRKTSQDSDSLYEIYSVFHMNLPNHRIQLSMLTTYFCRQNYLTIIIQHKILYSKLTSTTSNKPLQLAAGSRSRPEAGATGAEDQGRVRFWGDRACGIHASQHASWNPKDAHWGHARQWNLWSRAVAMR